MKNKYFENIEKVVEFSNWKNKVRQNWQKISITQEENIDNTKLVDMIEEYFSSHSLLYCFELVSVDTVSNFISTVLSGFLAIK